MTRINAYNKFMGFDLVDEKNEKHPYDTMESKRLDDMLKIIPALPVEPFVVLPGLPKNLWASEKSLGFRGLFIFLPFLSIFPFI